MWLHQLLLAIACASTLTVARPPPLPQPDISSEIALKRREEDTGFPKYFHEPGHSIIGAHYDSRYYVGENNYEDRRLTQMHMLRAYFAFFTEKGMETWIAHGTLLGWWWNGKMLPWDWDIDTQVSEATLRFMSVHHNMTKYDYVAEDDPTFKRTYLLDVNPAIVERERGNGNNVIDARFIDISNGLYIDVTGLSETHPEDKPGVWSCKNYHRYLTTELYPMRETVFEGVTAKVPYAYDRLLVQEYTAKALVVTDYEGHRWNSESKEWTKKSDEEIKAEKEALKKAKLKQKFAKFRQKAKKLRQKQEAEKQKKIKQEEAEKLEKAKQEEAAKLEEPNKPEAARSEITDKQENKPQEEPNRASQQHENTPQDPPQTSPPQLDTPPSQPAHPHQEASPRKDPSAESKPGENSQQV